MTGCRVFVGGLSNHVGERDLSKFFRSFGRLHDIVMKAGYCFVEFGNERDADDAVYKMNGKEMMGRRVAVEKARAAPRGGGQRAPMPRRYDNRGRARVPSRTNYRLIVKNLSSEVSWQKLKYFMRDVGEVNYADAHKYRRNEGVVEFATYSDMKNAMRRRDGKELCGRRIKLVYESDSRRSRSRSDSRSRSRSRSHSRSRSRSRSHGTRSRSRSHRRRSRSNSRSRTRSRSRSHSRSNSKSRRSDKQRSRSRSRSSSRNHVSKRSKSDSHSRSRSPAPKRTRSSRSPSAGAKKSRSESRSRSRSPAKERSRSRSPVKGRSRSRSPVKDRSRSRSPEKETPTKDKRQSHSRSRSPSVDQQSKSEQKERSHSRSRSRSVSRSRTPIDDRNRRSLSPNAAEDER